MKDQKGIRALSHLYRIVEASEKGLATVAANVPNPALKVLFQSHARQRAQFQVELLTELDRLGVQMQPRPSVPGMVHRGRVAIFAAMAIDPSGQEGMVLKEAAFGERVALRTYERALATDLPAETRQVIARQAEAVRQVGEQVRLLRGQDGKRLVTRLFSAEQDAGLAVRSLRNAGFSPESTAQVAVPESGTYRGTGVTVLETVLSGAVGGAIWGGLAGILVGFAVVQGPLVQPAGLAAALGAWLVFALSLMLLGIFIAAVLALFIGIAAAEDDAYQERAVLQREPFLVRTVADQGRAAEAGRILDRAKA